MPDKQQARHVVLSRRQMLSPAEVQLASQQVTQKVLTLVNLADCNRVHIYTPIPNSNEIDTALLCSELKQRFSKLEIVMGEPSPYAMIPDSKFDAVFTPCLGFNRDKFRLGYGGGWYDQFLSRQPGALKIGLAHVWSEVDFTSEPHDIPLDMILTDD